MYSIVLDMATWKNSLALEEYIYIYIYEMNKWNEI